MGWCALIRRMHMDNLYRQHIGKEVYTVTVCEFVTTRVCLHMCDCVCVFVQGHWLINLQYRCMYRACSLVKA